MADATEEEAEAAAKAKKKKMIIGGVVVAALAYQFVLKGSPPPEEVVDPAEVVIEEGEIAPLEELVVNLADTDEIHYLRLGVAAVINAEFALADIEAQLPKVNDVVIDTVATKTFDELRQRGATTALKEEISAATQEVFPDGEVVRVIFTTFVMQ